MQKAGYLQDNWRNVVFLLTGLIILIADQLSKLWIRFNILPGQSSFDIGFFRIIHAYNTGAAFGLFQDHSFVLAVIALIGAVVLLACGLVIYRRVSFLGSTLSKVALGLLLGGTIGNLVDRFRAGYVIDFIDFGFWPAFNVADSAVTVGVILFAYSLLRSVQAEKRHDG